MQATAKCWKSGENATAIFNHHIPVIADLLIFQYDRGFTLDAFGALLNIYSSELVDIG
jgi:hypothetical protein